MTSFRIEEVVFDQPQVTAWSELDPRYKNWPVVYTLGGASDVYVGESINAAVRLRQHLDSGSKEGLTQARVVIDNTFNKSVCLDLESRLIRLFAGDGRYRVLNRNDGISNAEYYGRADYQKLFDEIFDEMRSLGAFTRPVRDIENSDLFKLSPFKALTPDQAVAVEDILDGLFADLLANESSRIVIQGDPGTGKTVVAVYLMKLLNDIKNTDPTIPSDNESILSDFFQPGYPEMLAEFKVGLVVPQQSLRRSVQKVFAKTPALDPSMVISPFDVGESETRFNLLIVDETHRLNQRASQASGQKNTQYRTINEKLFGADDLGYTQFDWITAMSDHQIFLVDAAQGVRPADVTPEALEALVGKVDERNRRYRLTTQMRVAGGSDYVQYVRDALGGAQPRPLQFGEYDLRFFDDFSVMRSTIQNKDRVHGLSRLLAGYAWKWVSKKEKSAFDIDIQGEKLRWNQVDVDWVNSPGSVDEVGSIHTIQGYDLNYAGVVIGRDLCYDSGEGRISFDRANYFDERGKKNNKMRGITYTDEDLLKLVRNVYAVLLTRGMLGTYVYVCDPGLREYLRTYFTNGSHPSK